MSHTDPRNKLSGSREFSYYLGVLQMAVGVILFVSIFVSAAAGMSQGFGASIDPGSLAVRALVGMALMFTGRLSMNVGSRGLAGSGVVLDPQKAREDLEPWSRMAGGMAKDALDEADIHLNTATPAQEEQLSFDEKLRRIEQLHKDGLITDAEYQQKRSEVLNQKW